MKIAAISDVHEQWHDLTILPCDLLISAGDYSYLGKPAVVDAFHRWLADQPAKQIISLQGNHELWVESNWNKAVARVALIDDRIIFCERLNRKIQGYNIYCESVQPEFGGWAWNVTRGERIAKYWDAIPDTTEILVTHGPAYGILDQIERDSVHLGCEELRKVILERLPNLKLHIFGHIHGSSGIAGGLYMGRRRQFINASICNEDYKPINPVRYLTLEKE